MEELLNKISKGLPLEGRWRRIKTCLKQHHQSISVTSIDGNFKLVVEIDICNMLDEEEGNSRIKVKSQNSLASKKSSSSRSSRQEIKKNNSRSTLERSREKESELTQRIDSPPSP